MPLADPAILADPQRLAHLRDLCLLDTPADPAFDRLTRLATRILKVPISTVTLVDDHRQFFKSQVGVDEPWAERRETPLDYSYCQHVVATNSPLIIDDSRQHPLVYDNLLTTELGIVAYAGIPLVTSDGDVLGSFCVMDRKARVWTDEELEILVDLSKSVMTEIELRGELIQRRKIDEALRKSEQHLQAVISSAPVIIYVTDENGVISMTQGKGLSAVGITPTEIIGQSIFDVYGDSPEIVRAARQALSGKSSSYTAHGRGVSGPLHYEIYFSPLFDVENNIIGAVGVATDVTDIVEIKHTLESTIMRLTLLRRIEVELSESLDLVSVLTIAMDTALRASGAEHGFIGLIEGDQLRVVHSAGKYVTGAMIDSGTSIVGRAIRTLEPQLVPDVDADPDSVRDIPGVRAQMVIPLIHRDHLIGALSLKTAKPDLFTSDTLDFLALIAGHITVSIDNAQLYQVSQQQLDELHQLYMRVSELEQLKTDMIRIAAHDLRNPLGVVTGFAQLLLEEDSPLTAEQRTFVRSIDTAGQKMHKIIDDILSLQRIEARQDNKRCDEIDLGDMIREVFAGNETRAREKRLDFHLTLPDTPSSVCVDAAQMREAIDNLIGNAIKYTPEGGSVRVRMELEAKRVIFAVEDTGYGIPEDQQGRLFQPFFRASNAKESQIEGTGLGLHLVKNIVERHGGLMRFHSVLGQGSQFGFELPRS